MPGHRSRENPRDAFPADRTIPPRRRSSTPACRVERSKAWKEWDALDEDCQVPGYRVRAHGSVPLHPGFLSLQGPDGTGFAPSYRLNCMGSLGEAMEVRQNEAR